MYNTSLALLIRILILLCEGKHALPLRGLMKLKNVKEHYMDAHMRMHTKPHLITQVLM
jgi:Ser-tRNA(Ala) deacylase AlaX